ncbi:MAG TPA: polysaccharide biosynthesis/export family protein [Candidatus Gastranaerophilales bacterium]|nr:polysaccharide biosynthesis/export family protein [Candidatus Gastranaerophilales bacterium]
MKKKTSIILFLLFSFLCSQPLIAAKKETKPENLNNKMGKAYIKTFSEHYTVSPGDNLNIFIFGAPGLIQHELSVKCDGYIILNPIGKVKVAGFNTNEIKDILTAKLKRFFTDPVVSVQISNALM